MERGLPAPLRRTRSFIHSPSPHSYQRSHTTDPVSGGTSPWKAKGSALSNRYPFHRETTWYLYAVPRITPGMNPSQIPDTPFVLRGWELLFHPLKLPVTYTFSALGAHTAK